MTFQERAMEGAQPERAVSGWAVGLALFAGCLMIMMGLFQVFQGLAAVIDDDFFVLTRSYAFDLDVTAWGWVHIVTGSIVTLAGFYVFTGNTLARIIGIAIALIAALINFFYIPYYPVWSLLIIAVSIGVIWGLAVYDTRAAQEM